MLIKRINFYFLAIFLVAQCSLSAWWDAGHMAVAQLAYEELQPDVKDKVDQYIEGVSGSFPNHSNFIMASVWADDISNDGITSFREWHGSARPYDPYGILSQEERDKILIKFEDNDIVWATSECLDTIKMENSSVWAKGFMLRMLIHIVGDIHQPSHCITFYSPDFPNGDRAGTRFKIKHDIYKSLHSMFDGAFGLVDRKPERPMNEDDRVYIDNLVKYLRDNYPRELLPQLCDKNIDHWQQESYDIGVDFAYTNIFPNEEPTPQVIEEGKIITGRQLALAGYRLADLLNDLLGEKNK